jgi:hypothetical protein
MMSVACSSLQVAAHAACQANQLPCTQSRYPGEQSDGCIWCAHKRGDKSDCIKAIVALQQSVAF